MRFLPTLTLAAAVACLCAADAGAQSGRVKRRPPGAGRGGGSSAGGDAQSPGAGDAVKPAREEDYSRVFTGREVTQKARITRRPPPDYPRAARRNNVTGAVLLRIILRADGRVDDRVEVVKSLPEGVTEEAIKAAKRIEFVPAEKGGHKVSVYALVEYNFNIY
ncbi:MAG: energy transducer TonB [Pyrinomonadaceae bacterium]